MATTALCAPDSCRRWLSPGTWTNAPVKSAGRPGGRRAGGGRPGAGSGTRPAALAGYRAAKLNPRLGRGEGGTGRPEGRRGERPGTPQPPLSLPRAWQTAPALPRPGPSPVRRSPIRRAKGARQGPRRQLDVHREALHGEARERRARWGGPSPSSRWPTVPRPCPTLPPPRRKHRLGSAAGPCRRGPPGPRDSGTAVPGRPRPPPLGGPALGRGGRPAPGRAPQRSGCPLSATPGTGPGCLVSSTPRGASGQPQSRHPRLCS